MGTSNYEVRPESVSIALGTTLGIERISNDGMTIAALPFSNSKRFGPALTVMTYPPF
jgi:hypothetical protein